MPSWLDVLPWVLLGIRTAPKEDLRTSSAELIYGAPLTVPGDFDTVPHAPVSTTQHLQQLCDKVQSLALEGLCSIPQTKWHAQKFEQSKRSGDRCLCDILRSNRDLVKSPQ